MGLRAGFAILLLGMALAGHSDAHGAAAPRCQEDNPDGCWNWYTMGRSHTRGIYLTGRRDRVVVDACGYVAWHAARRIDFRRTDRLKGDYSAWSHRGECRTF